ncbi:MAG: RelA/SpoT family protein [Myxococcota bacterium]
MSTAKDGLNAIVDKVKGHHPGARTELIKDAFKYVKETHPRRNAGHIRVAEPLAVADILAELRLDVPSVCAGILHEIAAGGAVAVQDIRHAFGEEIAFLVDGVAKLDELMFTSHEDGQAESFRRMLVAIARDIRVVLVKLAHRLHKMRTLGAMARDAQQRVATETLEIYAPLAHRLGIRSLKVDFEDLSFRYLEPAAFAELEAQVDAVAITTDQYVADVVTQIERMLNSHGLYVEVSGRRKHLFSLHKKMLSHGIAFDQVQDFVAFRVTTDTVADCYATLGVIHAEWIPVHGRFKDYIARPKPNKYQSLHTTVFGPERTRVEIQIRTHTMHRTAEYGVAAHWLYKDHAAEADPKDVARFAWLRQLTESQRDDGDHDVSDWDLQKAPFAEDVYVFTSEGGVETLARGATPVDFAYAVDAEVGHRCAGARVNGSIVPIRHKLQNGDVVEIITHRSHRPNEHWLEFVATDDARTAIREYLRSETTPEAAQRGRELLDSAMHRRHIPVARFWKSPRMRDVLEEVGARSEAELCARVGGGELSADLVLDALVPQSQARGEAHGKRLEARPVAPIASRLRVEGMDEMVVRLAKCCHPTPGAEVVGFITRGRGVTVHRVDCPRVQALQPERRVRVSWEDPGEPSPGGSKMGANQCR